jgi:hypothetical protein
LTPIEPPSALIELRTISVGTETPAIIPYRQKSKRKADLDAERAVVGACVEELREYLETRSAPAAAGGTKKTTAKVDRDAEIDALAKHVKKATTGSISKDKIRGAPSRSSWPASAAVSIR